MSGGRATSVDLASDDAIQAVIVDIARNRAGLNWWGYNAGSEPRVRDIRGFPYLAVVPKGRIGSMQGARFVRGSLEREPGMSEPVYGWTIYALWPYRPENPITISTAQDAARKLEQAFTLEWTADTTADAMDLDGETTVGKIPGSGGYAWYGVTLNLAATQQLIVQYDP